MTAETPSAGSQLRQWRQESGITLNELAMRLEVTFSTVQRWEVGTAKPSSMVLRRHIERVTRGAVKASSWGR